ncbi:MarR family transcriptional regulator [Kitasatospora sp. NPDC057198]|uniref:MarR family transcriptional regulator n=1 Tax=Kitasatospora sp. NPDC057198 TaxID=3346046 RepID=UPI003637854A
MPADQDDRPSWGYAEVAAHLGISVGAARSRKSRGALPAPDDTTIPDRPRWKPSTFTGWKPRGQGYRSDLADRTTDEQPTG